MQKNIPGALDFFSPFHITESLYDVSVVRLSMYVEVWYKLDSKHVLTCPELLGLPSLGIFSAMVMYFLKLCHILEK